MAFVNKVGQKFSSKIARPFKTDEQIILRDYLALQRTTLSNERTLFSYIRTSLYLVLGGLGLNQVPLFENIKWIGTIALVISVIILIYGFTRYIVLRTKLQKFYNVIKVDDEDLERIENRNKKSSQQPTDKI